MAEKHRNITRGGAGPGQAGRKNFDQIARLRSGREHIPLESRAAFTLLLVNFVWDKIKLKQSS